MEENITINGLLYTLKSNTPLTLEQKNSVIEKISKKSLTPTKTLATGCLTSAIPVGTTKTFNCTASGGNGTYNYTLTIGNVVYNSPSGGTGSTWSKTHTFSTTGTITPVNLKVVDTCTGSTYEAIDSCTSGIIVQARSLATMTISGCTTTIIPTATCQLTVAGVDQFSSAITPQNVSWSSSNNTVATVNSTGLVTGVSNGIVTMTATSGSVTATQVVTVQAVCSAPTCSFTII